MIGKQELIECGWCGRAESLENWESVSYKGCKSREMRRAYKTLQKEGSYRRGSNTFYQCPKCEMWIRGSQLTVKSEEYRHLGGDPVMEEVEEF